jgi:hypothetical protein
MQENRDIKTLLNLYVFMVEVTGVFDYVDGFIDDESPVNWDTSSCQPIQHDGHVQ